MHNWNRYIFASMCVHVCGRKREGQGEEMPATGPNMGIQDSIPGPF
jgi:hypothetical protein